MRLRHLICLVLVAAFMGGCRGPKDDCEGTVHSYESIIDGQHWDDYPDIVYPPLRKKYGDRNIRNWVAVFYEGAQKFKFTAVNATVSKDVCLVQTQSSWYKKIRGQNPESIDDEYNAYTLHLVDGKWYMELPGAAKLQAF